MLTIKYNKTSSKNHTIPQESDESLYSIDSIHSDNEDNMEKWAEINRIYSEKWPVITEKKDSPKDAKDWEDVDSKFDNHFSEKPGL